MTGLETRQGQAGLLASLYEQAQVHADYRLDSVWGVATAANQRMDLVKVAIGWICRFWSTMGPLDQSEGRECHRWGYRDILG